MNKIYERRATECTMCVCVQVYETFKNWQVFCVEVHFPWEQKPWRQQNIFIRICASVPH